MSALTVFL